MRREEGELPWRKRGAEEWMLRPGRASSRDYIRKQQQLFCSWLKTGVNNNIIC